MIKDVTLEIMYLDEKGEIKSLLEYYPTIKKASDAIPHIRLSKDCELIHFKIYEEHSLFDIFDN